jgi:hypothetical protein
MAAASGGPHRFRAGPARHHLPSRIRISVGTAWIVNRSDTFGALSTSTLTSLTLPARSPLPELSLRHGSVHVRRR